MPCIDFELTYETTGDEEEDVRALTQQIARSLEGFVRRFPDQWFAFREVLCESEARESVPSRWKTRRATGASGL
jgi:hypothetical protein